MKKVTFFILLLISFQVVNAQVTDEPCYQRIGVEGGEFDWNITDLVSGTIEETIIQPGANAGFTLDIFYLDNSFNMVINGVDLATSEIEFQSSGTSGINIRFKDGDQYEANTGGAIWQMRGDAQSPLIRVHIDENGNVTLYGSKISYGPLYELELFDGNSLNTINWNPTEDNTIVVRQNVVSTTGIDGRGYGLSTIPCEEMYTLSKEGAFNDANSDGFAESGDIINYVFEIKHIGNHEPIYDVQIQDDLLSTLPIELSAGVNMLGGTLTGDLDSNNILDIGETWQYSVDYAVTSEDIYSNQGVYNRASLDGKRDTGQQLPFKPSFDPTPYQDGDTGWDPSRPDDTYVSLKGRRPALSNPILLSRGSINE